jgi:hypothetical protein
VDDGAGDEVARVIALLRPAILAGVIPPGAKLAGGRIGATTGVHGNQVARALGLLRAEGLAHWEGHAFYAAPAGPPDPRAGVWLGRMLAAARAAEGLSVPWLAARAAGAHGDDSPDTRKSLAARRAADITAAEAGTWQPRHAWQWIDAGLQAGGNLLRVHDLAYSRPWAAGEVVRGRLPAGGVAGERG